MQIHVGCTFRYTLPAPTPMVFIVRPSQYDRHQIIEEIHRITPSIPVEDFIDPFGNRLWRLVAPIGPLEVYYDGLVTVSPEPDLILPDLRQTPVERLPYDVLPYTLPSRYCDSDLFMDDAWRLFGGTEPGWGRVQAVCDWIHANITYGTGSTSHTSGYQAYVARRGVCRDFAHIGVSFCRALNIPARYICGYLPDVGVPPDPRPMDFHAWFEVYLDGGWHFFDARHNIPRTGRVLISRGRDAADVALSTSYGSSPLDSLRVWAEEVDARFAGRTVACRAGRVPGTDPMISVRPSLLGQGCPLGPARSLLKR